MQGIFIVRGPRKQPGADFVYGPLLDPGATFYNLPSYNDILKVSHCSQRTVDVVLNQLSYLDMVDNEQQCITILTA